MFPALKSAVAVWRPGVYIVKASSRNLAGMSFTWQSEKEKNLKTDASNKCKNYVKLDSIPTWKQYASRNKNKLPVKREAKVEAKLDSSKNAVLCDKISIFFGDITTLEVDAIVNAANSSLLGGGGVDGAIHSAAGPYLLQECKTLNGCPTGEAKITGGYKLPAKYVIHTVGPQGEKEPFLKNCYITSLQLMRRNHLRSIAFPCISTGIYGYPNTPAAHVAIYTVRKFLEEQSEKVERVIFCLFMDVDKDIYQALLQSYFPLD